MNQFSFLPMLFCMITISGIFIGSLITTASCFIGLNNILDSPSQKHLKTTIQICPNQKHLHCGGKGKFSSFLMMFLTLSQTSPGFTCLQYKSFENTMGKGEIARNEQFLLFPQCFLLTWRTFSSFHQIRNCRLQTLSVWKSLKFVVWERVKDHSAWCCLT